MIVVTACRTIQFDGLETFSQTLPLKEKSDNHHKRQYLYRAVLVEHENDSSSVDAEEQLDEVIQIRVENEHVESEPLLQPQASMVHHKPHVPQLAAHVEKQESHHAYKFLTIQNALFSFCSYLQVCLHVCTHRNFWRCDPRHLICRNSMLRNRQW